MGFFCNFLARKGVGVLFVLKWLWPEIGRGEHEGRVRY